MIYAIQGGLSAAEILGRTQGSIAWALFYGTFVVAVSVHASIGLRVIVARDPEAARHGVVAADMGSVRLARLLAMGLPGRLRGDCMMLRPHRNHPLWLAFMLHRSPGSRWRCSCRRISTCSSLALRKAPSSTAF